MVHPPVSGAFVEFGLTIRTQVNPDLYAILSKFIIVNILSHDETTLYERVSIHWSIGWSVTLSLFGLLGAIYSVYTVLFYREDA